MTREVGNGNLGEDARTKCGEETEAVASEMSLQSPPGEHTASVSSSSNLFQISLGPHGSSPYNTSCVPPLFQLCILIAFSFPFYPVMPTRLTRTKILQNTIFYYLTDLNKILESAKDSRSLMTPST